MSTRRLIVIRDETLRDGTQQKDLHLTQKDRLNIALLSAQILTSKNRSFRNQIDLGMPEASYYILKSIQKIVGLLKNNNLDFFVTGTSRKKAIQAMVKSLEAVPDSRKIIAPFLGISYLHRQKLGLTKEQAIQKAIEVVKYSKLFCSRIHFPLEGGYYAYLEEPEFVLQLLKALEQLEVECIVFCDTVGTALPFSGDKIISYGNAIKEIKSYFPKLKIAAHCHNDLGLATANSLEALIIGHADIIDGSFLGLGERCGNAPVENLLLVLNAKGKDLGLRIEANLKDLYTISNKIAKICGLDIPKNQPIIGENAFVHIGGIHQDGTIKNKKTYESFTPKKIGHRGHEIFLGPLSGEKGIKYILAKNYHLKNIDPKLLNLAIRRFKNLGNLRKNNPEIIFLKILCQVLLAECRKSKK